MYRALKIINERKVDVVVAMQEAGVGISHHMFVCKMCTIKFSVVNNF